MQMCQHTVFSSKAFEVLSSTLQKWLLFFASEGKSGYFIGLSSSVKRGEIFSFHELFSTLSDVLTLTALIVR